MVKTQFNATIRRVRSDNGAEFFSTNIVTFFNSLGVVHEHSCVNTPQQNGVVERKHRHLLNVARALRFHSNLPLKFWGECILTATYLINRTPSKVLKGKTPFEILFNKAPKYAHLRVFGCLCFGHNVHIKHKFDFRAHPGIFIGYPFGQKGYKIFDIRTQKIYVSRDVTFHENVFPSSVVTTDVSSLCLPLPISNIDFPIMEQADSLPSPASPTNDIILHPASITTDPPPAPPIVPILELRRSQRRTQIPSRFKDYQCFNVHPQSSSPASGTHFLLHQYLSYSRFSHPYCAFLHSLSSDIEPATFTQAAKFPEWREAMQIELNALEDTHTWSLVSLPADKQPIGCKWVYKIKRKSDGSID
ncbi:hypothetical protein SLE2022_150590 [Rubroshorea leprosula]